jgi:alpha-beta hydrolase superfamily lysophospholipase
MFQERRFKFEGEDGVSIAGYRWKGFKPAKAVLQVSHGAGEHAGRYPAPLSLLIEDSWDLYADDHRGHGATSPDSLGDFGPGGASAVIGDMTALTNRIREENPGVPVVMMGHSMGAMLAQTWMLDHSHLVDAIVLSGTCAFELLPADIDFNAGFEGRTAYDWLSRDPAEVDRYVADPRCGINFTDESRASFAPVVMRQVMPDALAKVRKDLPIYVVVGDEDPLNDHLARLQPVLDRFTEAGLTNVTLKVYPGGRHEMLNETNQQAVVEDLKAWLEAAVGV